MKSVNHPDSWIEAVAHLSEQGQPYVLITVLGSRGSTPRDSGTKMLASEQGFFGSIGGGHLEFKALEIAADMLATGRDAQRVEHLALGASLGQCCGGRHTLLFESFAANRFNIAVFGAGHVGRSLTGILQQLPCRLHWVDGRENQFAGDLPANVYPIVESDPSTIVQSLPVGSYYLIMTHSHRQDFDILEAVLQRGDARFIGLIGSRTKWRRFKMRLGHKGHSAETYGNVCCPVGLEQVPGKLPAEVAVSIAGQVIAEYHADNRERPAGQDVALRDVRRLIESDATAPAGE
jgi:xanthine dehydrogenase accessory factor